MGIREQRSPCCQCINRRCLHQRMSAEAADPVVLVINGNEENVGPPGTFGIGFAPIPSEQDEARDPQKSIQDKHPVRVRMVGPSWRVYLGVATPSVWSANHLGERNVTRQTSEVSEDFGSLWGRDVWPLAQGQAPRSTGYPPWPTEDAVYGVKVRGTIFDGVAE